MTTFVDPFIRSVDEYRRQINPLGDYKEQALEYLHIQTGQPREVCRQYLTKALGPGGVYEFKDTPCEYFERGDTLDRVRKTDGILQYIGDVVKNREILAPTFTSYKHPDVETSLLALDIDAKKKLRSIAKKAMFKAKAEKNEFLYTLYDNEQTQRKRSNNALSGAANTVSTPLFNKTSHSTLTSTCRITSGYGNACNERLLSGNRHYYHWDVVFNNITSIITHTDYEALESMLSKWQLKYPTVQETVDCITYSTNLYWKVSKQIEALHSYISKLTDLQRAAFVYTGDLHHVKQYNPEFMRQFLTELTDKVYEEILEPVKFIHAAPETHLCLAHQICTDEVKGIGKDYSKLKDPKHVFYVAGTIANIQRVLMKYKDFIQCIMATDNLPASVASFPESIRRAAVTSDTDSTIFTVQDWVIWYMGKVDFSPRGISIQAAMTFLTSSAIIHALAVMSANMGVAKKHIFEISMKSEYRFDVFVPTQVSKTYYAAIGCREGSVFDEHEIEIKGVMLKSSAYPKDLNDQAAYLIKRIMDTVMRGEKISILEVLKEVADVERKVIASILKGETHYLRSGTIKDMASYSQEENESPYQNHTFWQRTFACKYGDIAPPPYKTSKISLDLDSSKKFTAWLDGMEDKVLAEKIRAYFAEKGRRTYTTFHAPDQILSSSGIPIEIAQVIDKRKIAGLLCKSFYLILETLGVYGYQTKVRRLVSDSY